MLAHRVGLVFVWSCWAVCWALDDTIYLDLIERQIRYEEPITRWDGTCEPFREFLRTAEEDLRRMFKIIKEEMGAKKAPLALKWKNLMIEICDQLVKTTTDKFNCSDDYYEDRPATNGFNKRTKILQRLDSLIKHINNTMIFNEFVVASMVRDVLAKSSAGPSHPCSSDLLAWARKRAAEVHEDLSVFQEYLAHLKEGFQMKLVRGNHGVLPYAPYVLNSKFYDFYLNCLYYGPFRNQSVITHRLELCMLLPPC